MCLQCQLELRRFAKFCERCGQQVDLQHQGVLQEDDLAIIGASLQGVSSQDNPMTMDMLLNIMKSIYEKAGVKEETSGYDSMQILDPSEKVVKVDDLRFTHDTVSNRFSNGRSFHELVSGLDSGAIDAMTAPFLHLEAFHWPRKGYYSVNNRRLLCLKRHQDHVRSSQVAAHVTVKVKVWPLPEAFAHLLQANPRYEKLMWAYSTRSHGCGVRVRN